MSESDLTEDTAVDLTISFWKAHQSMKAVLNSMNNKIARNMDNLKDKTVNEVYTEVQQEFLAQMEKQNQMLSESIVKGGCARFHHPYT